MASVKPMKLELQAEFPYEEEAEHTGMGTTRMVGYAVKGTPFRLALKLVSKARVSLSNAQVQLQLLTEETYAPVDIGERPIRWESTTSGNFIYCDVRLAVLSTQLAKSCVVIKAFVSLDGQKALEAMSQPIKVVSKPEQIRRKRKEANQNPELEGSKKRARSEDVLVELRSLYEKSQTLLEAARQSKEANTSFSSTCDPLGASDDDTTATDWLTDDGETYSTMTDSMSETGSALAVDCEPPTPKRACLVTSFENILHSFDQAILSSEPLDLQAVPFHKLKAAFNLLDLPQPVYTDEYH